MNMHVVPQAAPPPPPEKKYRTITLTNRAPVQIDEAEWDTIAEGKYCDEESGGPDDFVLIEIRVRAHKPRPPRTFTATNGVTVPLPQHRKGYIIHANYQLYMEERYRDSQRVRVGRHITDHEAACNLWKHISEVADELRERIDSDFCRKHVTAAVDDCFASLGAQVL